MVGRVVVIVTECGVYLAGDALCRVVNMIEYVRSSLPLGIKKVL